MTLQELLDAITSGDDQALTALLSDTAALAELLADVEDLATLESEAVRLFDQLRGNPAPSDEDVDTLEALVSTVEAVRAEQARRDQLAAEQQARIDELASRLNPAAGDDGGQDEGGQDEGGDEGQDEGGQADGGDEGQADGDGDGGGQAGDGQAVAASSGSQRAAASSRAPARRPAPRVNLSTLARRTGQPAAPPAEVERRGRGTLVAAADVPGTTAGSEYADVAEMAAAAQRRFGSMPGPAYEGRYQAGIAVIRKQFPETLVASGSGDDMEVLDRAASETRLDGGSLLAAGGWCAPSETWYDLCEMESTDGLIDLPEVVANRGGIRWTTGPDFSAIFSNIGFLMTEAQAEAGEEKPCYEVPCPDFEECRLDAIGYCVSAGILTNRAYPELIARFLRGAAAAHAHRYSAETIRRMVDGSTLVTFGGGGLGAVPTLMGALELQAEDYRYRQRLSRANGRPATLEVLLPYWLRGLLRADWMRRNGCCDDKADAEIDDWFRTRYLRPQWVYNWQDAFVDDGEGLGGETPVTTWPETLQVLMYAAGTWVRATSDIISLDAVYDSTLFRTNRYNAVFFEEGLCVIKRCHDSRLIEIPLCPDGATGEQRALACPTA